MEDIKTITACSDDKTEQYRLLNMLHVMAGKLSLSKIDNWGLKCVATYPEYALTTYTNGIIDIEVVSSYGQHTYTMKAVEVEED